jgi:predicted nucleotidyltransferase
MSGEVRLRRDELQALCRPFRGRRLDLFGSAARGEFDREKSDVDFLVEFDRGHPQAPSFKAYPGLRDATEVLFGRPVDRVEPSALRNPYLKASIERARAGLCGVIRKARHGHGPPSEPTRDHAAGLSYTSIPIE